MAIITTENLSKHFGALQAVKDVSFQVDEGEIFGFLGPNGAGKTTTINMLCTLLKPTAGRATVDGYDVAKQRSQVRHAIGLVFQESTLDDYLTAEQNLLFRAYAYAIPREIREPRLKELLDLVELWERRKGRISTYSGGMKRRLEIARGLLHHPKVLFLDEPTLGLDPQTRRTIWAHIRELRQRENLTIFMTTHYMDEAENCDRIAIIDNGSIVAKEAVRQLKEQYHLEPQLKNGLVTFTVPNGEEFLPGFVAGFSQRLLSIGLDRPTLDDVFIKLTGRAIREQEADFTQQLKMRMRMRGH
jgi:ABC-2 type transport system ATP-binding protein